MKKSVSLFFFFVNLYSIEPFLPSNLSSSIPIVNVSGTDVYSVKVGGVGSVIGHCSYFGEGNINWTTQSNYSSTPNYYCNRKVSCSGSELFVPDNLYTNGDYGYCASSCPAGQIDNGNGECIPDCIGDEVIVDGVCQLVCPTGQIDNGNGTCICPTDTYFCDFDETCRNVYLGCGTNPPPQNCTFCADYLEAVTNFCSDRGGVKNAQCTTDQFCNANYIDPECNDGTDVPPDLNGTIPPVGNNPIPEGGTLTDPQNNTTQTIDFGSLEFVLDNFKNENSNNLNNLGNKLDDIGNSNNDISSKLDTLNNSINDGNSDTSGKLGTTNSSLTNINNNLSGIGTNISDFKNENNDNLQTINQTLQDLNNSLNPSVDLDEEGTITDISNFITDVQGEFTNISNIADGFKSIVDGGFSMNLPTTSNDVSFQTTVFNQEITFDLCTPFIGIKPIVTFIFTLFFLFLSIRIFFYGLRSI